MSAQDTPLTPGDVAKVAELAVEPSYISEIARKLESVDSQFDETNHLNNVQFVARAVQGLESEGSVVVERPDLGGQKQGSQHESLADGETGGWREYTIVHTQNTDFDDVRDLFKGVVDPDMTVGEKREIVEFLSRQGNNMAEVSEEVVQDQLGVLYDNVEVSGYNTSDIDATVELEEKAYAVEVSVRWVNPVGVPYINSKLNHLADKEAEIGKEVDLIVMAPVFTRSVWDRYDDTRFIHLRELPARGQGTPVIIFEEGESLASTEALLGDRFPIVAEDFETFRNDLDDVFREFNVVSERVYRAQIVNIVQGIVNQQT